MAVFSEYVPVTVEKDTAFQTVMMHYAVADPGLQIRGGGGGGGSGGSYSDSEIRGERSQKNVFSALRASVWFKTKREARPPGPLPWIRQCYSRTCILP